MNLETAFIEYKERALFHRYITNDHIAPLLKKMNTNFEISVLGDSVNDQSIFGLKVGTGHKKILLWSQMHGNESTTTKALFDLFNYLNSDKGVGILNACTLFVIPILNPDGAKAYTRVNANNVDLNRDAQNLSQPESLILKNAFDHFEPDFCFNLHGQRTIFSAGHTNNSATVSFLAPAQDAECLVTPARKVSMEIIATMNADLQNYLSNQVGIYDDAFNINCVGDTFQTKNVPTVLFEAGHYHNDYSREEVRKYIFMSLVNGIELISKNDCLGENHELYFSIPENQKLFYDILIKSARVVNEEMNSVIDIAIQYEEVLRENEVKFVPKVANFGDLSSYYSHKTIDAKQSVIQFPDDVKLEKGSSIDFVKINNELFSLYLMKI